MDALTASAPPARVNPQIAHVFVRGIADGDARIQAAEASQDSVGHANHFAILIEERPARAT
jgi:hypothetical protein